MIPQIMIFFSLAAFSSLPQIYKHYIPPMLIDHFFKYNEDFSYEAFLAAGYSNYDRADLHYIVGRMRYNSTDILAHRMSLSSDGRYS